MPLEAIAGLLHAATGMDVQALGASNLRQAVRARLAATGLPDVERYAAALRGSPQELDELVEAVVVPETWFFREVEGLRTLAELVSSEWAPAHAGETLRVLSAPCSTGEEPYSIAMTLLDAGIAPERMAIRALDLSTRALAKARVAVYGSNSFRGVSRGLRARYFTRTPEGYELASRVRERVSFTRGNLVQDDFAEPGGPYHFIFCRNVLIYMDAATQSRVLGKLARLLAPDGVLLVGAAEAFPTRLAGFEPVKHPGAFAFRKGTPLGAREPAKAQARKRPAPALRAPHLSPKPAPGPLPAAIEPPARGWAEARQLADAGHLVEAGALGEELLRAEAPSAEGYCLLGLVRDSLGETEEAAECYRKALYLEPGHADALQHLSLLLGRRGDAEGAQRLLARARRQAEAAAS